ncbi:MAG: response regulator transcription factor [Oscillospiraceae bacterium]|jgi:two-component system response regulator VicR|nr:response regulator transcription factor [Oscillospiraceae bacterium]
MRKILIVDDEKNLVDILKFNLKREYDVAEAYDGEEALEQYRTFTPDLILLDVMLPKIDGFEVCRKIREKDMRTSIIMFTARIEESDRVLGLEIGCDDYITKPFVLREVQLRIKANMRRLNDGQMQEHHGTEGIAIDDARLDAFVDGAAAELTPREFELLKVLMASPGRVVSREELLRDVWQYDYFGDARAVDVAVRRLREKIEKDTTEPKYIMTKRGAGYYYAG